MDAGQSSDVHPSAVEDEGDIVEIKIKTLDSQSHTLRVDKNTPVPALKVQIASVVGVPVENQRLICRGKVLKDDQLLRAYNVEDGHTLHLVARQPRQSLPFPSTSGQDQVTGRTSPQDTVMVSPHSRPGHVSHSLLMGTINIPDSGEGGLPDLNRIMSAVLNSVGMGNAVPAATGVGPGGSVAVGMVGPRAQQISRADGQPRADGANGSSSSALPLGEQNDSIDDIEAQLQLDAIYGAPSPGIFVGTGPGIPSDSFRIAQQPMVVPDALSTMSQYLDRLEQSFSIIGGGRGHNVIGGPPASEGPNQVEGNAGLGLVPESLSQRIVDATYNSSPGFSVPSSNTTSGRTGQGFGVQAGLIAASRRLPTPASLGIIVNRVQHLLSEQAGTALARLAGQLENEPGLVDPVSREEMQRTAFRDGNMMQQLGALLLELGRTTLTLRMGPSPAESVVNAGPAVFISASGPNPMMVQSLPLQTGGALGVLPSGIQQANAGNVGATLGPRSINIHIHTSDLRVPAPSATPASQQPPPRAVIGASSGAPVLTVRNLIEGGDATNPEHSLTVRQIIERAEAASGVQHGSAEMASQATSGGAVQGAIMTFNENGAMRVVPVRTRTATVPIVSSISSVNEGDQVFERFQQESPSLPHGRPASTPLGSTILASTDEAGPIASGQHPLSMAPAPSVRAQVHIQAWAPSIIQTLGGSNSHPRAAQPMSGAPPLGEMVLPQVTRQGHIDGESSVPVPNASVTNGEGPGQLQERMVQNVDIAQIVDSLGPFLSQLAVVFQQPRPQASQLQASEQVNEPLVTSQPHAESNIMHVAGAAGPPDSTSVELSLQNGGAQISSPLESDSEGLINLEDKLSTDDSIKISQGSQDDHGNRLPNTLSLDGHYVEGIPSGGESQLGGDQPVAPPIGLGDLQPLPSRSRRRALVQSRQVSMTETGSAASARNVVPGPGGREQTSAPVWRGNLQQSLVVPMDRLSGRPEDNGLERPGQLSHGILPLLGSIGNRGITQGDGARDLGDIISQLMSRAAVEGSVGQGAFPGDMLRGVMGQLVQSPLVENLVQQVMIGVQNDETQDAERSFIWQGNPSHGTPIGFDLAGVVQQMVPVMSQMFGGQPRSDTAQQVPCSANISNHNDGVAARDSPGRISDSGRWREALREEEITSWSETISADKEQQHSMEPQRPFSDLYVRGSPLAKRQKTELEGTALKLDNGCSTESILTSAQEGVPAEIVGSNGLTNSKGLAQLAQQRAPADGMANIGADLKSGVEP